MLTPPLNTISVVCVCDNHYAVLMAALIKSIEMNHRTDEKLEFYIVDDHISPDNKDKINQTVTEATTQIHWKFISDCIPPHMQLPMDKSSLPLNIYIRLFIPYFVSPNLNRIIFLDVDMIMLQDISVLWHHPLHRHIIAAVQDQWLQTVSHWGAITNYRQLGMEPDDKYFNAGLMVIDLDKWTEMNVSDKVIECLEVNKTDVTFQDQYGLNVVLAGKWDALDPLWNCFAYSDENIKPFLIHFSGRKPIYKSYPFNKSYQKLFFFYLEQSGWGPFKPIGEIKRYIKKISNILSKKFVFPWSRKTN